MTTNTRGVSFKLSKEFAEGNHNPNQEISKMQIRQSIKNKEIYNRKQKDLIKKAYENNFNKWRDYDLLTALIALIGLALALVDYEYSWTTANEQVTAYNAANGIT
jgi:hypothetical protein